MAWGPFFLCPGAVWMNLDGGAVDAHLLDPDGQDLLLLQTGKQTVQHPGFAPPVHAGVNGVPVPEMGWQSPPFTAIFHHVEEGVEQLKIGQGDIAALARQAVSDTPVLAFCEFHAAKHNIKPPPVNEC